MADERPSLFTTVSVAYGSNYLPILVQTSPGSFANAKVAVSDFEMATGEPVGLEAYALAQVGTNAAATAQSTANSAQVTANAAQLAAASAQNVGSSAFSIAVTGTNVAASAFSIAVAGTNTAATAQSTANSAFSIAVDGTNAAATANSVANSAWALAQIGTNTGSAAYALALSASGSSSGQIAMDAYAIAVAGTNAAATAQSTANAAYALAQIGTNTGSTAYSAAQTAYSIAQIGTNTGTAAYNLAVAALPKSGGTLTANLYLPNTVFGVGTTPVSSAVSGTIYYDFAGSAYQQTTASGTFQVSAKNYFPGISICAIIISDGVTRAIGYDSAFAWFGTQVPATSTTSGKQILVTMTSTGNTASGILGATIAQL